MYFKNKTKYPHLLLSLLLMASAAAVEAQTVNPTAYYTDKEGTAVEETASIDDGEAPLTVEFRANPSDMGTKTPSYEWHLRYTSLSKDDPTEREVFMRNDENTTYTFMESGNYKMTLRTFLTEGTDVDELDSMTISITIAESKLEMPNAFSPNGDGINDIYRAKPEYKNIVSFRAIILNRWGQKLYEWNDPAGGWDGKFHGRDVNQGVYFVLVEAKGADGKDYKIKKDVNLLRGYTENGNTTGGGNE